ncbi:unnamed protein product [Ectocarpus sp. 8 AP-2014]
MRCRISLLACCCFLSRESAAFVPAARVSSSLQHHAAGSRASSSRRTVSSKMQAELAAEVDTMNEAAEVDGKKKVVVIGAGWAGLAAAYELSKQNDDFDVTLLEGGKSVGGLVAGWLTPGGRPVEAGVHGFWYPYRNIFRLIEDDLKIDPFTPWTQSAQYSPNGLEVISPIFQNMPRLPSPMGTFLYPSFLRLPWFDRLTALGLLASVVDWDNTPEAWRKYDKYTARELFRMMGCSERLYRDAFEPMLLVGLFAPGEQCSAAGALGMLYFFILAHQADFDVKWCRGTTGEMIFKPWVQRIEENGAKVLVEKRVSDVEVCPDTGRVVSVRCGGESFPCDAVVSAVGINGVKGIVRAAPGLSKLPFFSKMMNLRSVDALAVRLYLDRRVRIPYQSNACFGFDKTTGWTFFDLTAMHDSLDKSEGTVLEADFYHADQLLPRSDQDLVAKVQGDIATCVSAVGRAKVVDYSVVRIAQGVTHFSPGSYDSMPTCETPIPNMFMSGDWIVNDHGSFSQGRKSVRYRGGGGKCRSEAPGRRSRQQHHPVRRRRAAHSSPEGGEWSSKTSRQGVARGGLVASVS